jgi:hypothetical protein
MSQRLSIMGAAAILALLAAPSLAGVLEVKTVHFSTCTLAGVEHGCVIAKGDDGVTYNVTGAVPGLKANQWLQGKAAVTNRASFCMQGSTIGNFVPDKDQKQVSCGEAE